MKKRIVTMMLVTAMAVSVAACGNAAEETQTEESAVAESSYEWDAGELAYLELSREELLEIYDRQYDLWLNGDMDDDAIDEQVAEEYGLEAEDVSNISLYGCEYNYFITFNSETVEVTNGSITSVRTNGGVVQVVAEMDSSKKIVDKCYSDACEFVRAYIGNAVYDSVEYSVISDDVYVITFDISADTIDAINAQEFDDSDLGDYVDNLNIAYGVE